MGCRASASTDPLVRRRVPSGLDVSQRRPREVALMIFVGDDCAEDHHDVYLMDEAGQRLAARRLPEGLSGIRACTS